MYFQTENIENRDMKNINQNIVVKAYANKLHVYIEMSQFPLFNIHEV